MCETPGLGPEMTGRIVMVSAVRISVLGSGKENEDFYLNYCVCSWVSR